MNESVGTTKLLWLQRDRSPSAGSLATDTVAVRIGAASSVLALVDNTDPNKLLICQVTYTEPQGRHKDLCLQFVASGENKRDNVKRLLVNKMESAKLADRLPELVDRIHTVNFVECVPKSAALLFDLIPDCAEDILYACTTADVDAAQQSPTSRSAASALVDSTEAGSHITKLSNGQPQVTALPDEAHKLLAQVRHQLLQLLPDAGYLAESDDEPVEFQLTHLMHSLRLSDQSGTFQRAFADCVEPAIAAYAAVLTNSGGAEVSADDDCANWYICDCIFNSDFCRQALTSSLAKSPSTCRKTIRFVKDMGLLAFLGALVRD